ncbi:hypothetical protein [Kineosporia succinea]|uniref:EndoU nuclease-like protein n=1 Tax=Kineosporia succinea TaxID=84632 RepID=A0ABT9PCE7_9ACTN|nr:hypothetical protein [Kineosporia succinea]MDP9829845.1 hypothetical protein [Kineosporia succinea]
MLTSATRSSSSHDHPARPASPHATPVLPGSRAAAANVQELRRIAMNASVSGIVLRRQLETYEPGHNRYTNRQIATFVEELPGGQTPAEAVALFRARFPYQVHDDLARMRRMLRGLPDRGTPRPDPAVPVFRASFDGHLTGADFANGGAGYHVYRAQTLPAGVAAVNPDPAYDEGAYIGNVTRAHGPPVRSTFFPDSWDVARVRREIVDHWLTLRNVHGIVHVVRRGANRVAIGVNIVDGQIVSAFPAHRGAGGRWSTEPP